MLAFIKQLLFWPKDQIQIKPELQQYLNPGIS